LPHSQGRKNKNDTKQGKIKSIINRRRRNAFAHYAGARSVKVTMPSTPPPIIIEVNAASKSYATDVSGWARLRGWLGGNTSKQKRTCVLQPLSLTISQGEVVGIIGRNGSGKSTLLKLIVGTLAPTTGLVQSRGRITALLELGLGFNPEYSGRDNVINYLALNGLSQARIQELIPAVESFAEIGDYFFQPMRTYSSGMQMRVAFAAATASRPDVLIVDEALAVGDSYFVHKCIARIRSFCAEGTTLLYVSHDMSSIRTLCNRAILLDAGALCMDDIPAKVCDYYNGLLAEKEEHAAITQAVRSDNWVETRSGNQMARILSVCVRDGMTDAVLTKIKLRQEIRICIEIEARAGVKQLVVGVMLKDRVGHLIWGSNTWHANKVVTQLSAELSVLHCELALPCLLGPGSYGVTVALHENDQHFSNNYDWLDNAVVFDVERSEDENFFVGSSFLPNSFYFKGGNTEAFNVGVPVFLNPKQ
jgi:lipopolysaccharide transport system ATP-binding protein